ncbi:type II secretion system protein [Puniceicoccus vermicola]|uniref:Prepilin-type N-terminal cleavage/methylation domain-containing protein n=1 Tax=Puniceicoccus vermicola TaxID=388746 RepID=A0A7X1E5Q7_9BACT|nr:prepilin-type N-terminal cleavage/methylation domain-containing protein [Puniceicoccus vermicola]MBC2603394.1 prepilin-type N-terminal cleavage/methylation domain-containing protein [Puniceicoccus vermicola]
MIRHSSPTHMRASARETLGRGFTLIELLTVIAILGVLAAIIIPSLRAVRLHSVRTASASNLRQWSSAFLLYSSENGQRIPYEGSYDQPSWSQVRTPKESNAWFNVLPPLVEAPALNEMRSGDERAAMINGLTIHSGPGLEVDARENRRRPFFSYMMNSQIYSDEDGAPGNSGDALIRLVLIPNPSKTIFLTETRSSIEEGAPNEDESRVGRAKGRNNSISFRYDDRSNVAFLDGHVATVDSETLYNAGRDPSVPGGQLDDFVWYPW